MSGDLELAGRRALVTGGTKGVAKPLWPGCEVQVSKS
jgi:hypothetical protein